MAGRLGPMGFGILLAAVDGVIEKGEQACRVALI